MKNVKAKLKQQGGFTLIEMLLVVAIISILVAISIPMISTNLEQAREATDAANERAAKTLALLLYTGEIDPLSIEGMDPVSPYIPGTPIYMGENEFGQAEGIYYDAENGVLTCNIPTEGYGQSTSHLDEVIVVGTDYNGVVKLRWRYPFDGGI